jgi:hypothetical protein
MRQRCEHRLLSEADPQLALQYSQCRIRVRPDRSTCSHPEGVLPWHCVSRPATSIHLLIQTCSRSAPAANGSAVPGVTPFSSGNRPTPISLAGQTPTCRALITYPASSRLALASSLTMAPRLRSPLLVPLMAHISWKVLNTCRGQGAEVEQQQRWVQVALQAPREAPGFVVTAAA